MKRKKWLALNSNWQLAISQQVIGTETLRNGHAPMWAGFLKKTIQFSPDCIWIEMPQRTGDRSH